MTNYIREYKMTYHAYRREWMSLYVLTEAQERLTADTIERTLLRLIAEEVEMGNDPWVQVNEAQLREADWGECLLKVASPSPAEQESPAAQRRLTKAVMQTQEVETALSWMRGRTPSAETKVEVTEEDPILLADFLWGIKLSEWDSGMNEGW